MLHKYLHKSTHLLLILNQMMASKTHNNPHQIFWGNLETILGKILEQNGAAMKLI